MGVCIDCGKSISKNSKKATKRCKSCFVVYQKTKDYRTQMSESQNTNEFCFDTVSEMSEGRYGQRISDGFGYER